ncbi:hypothetical protein BFW01_g5916 [Lasiodiplodia theobromae]|nr:hypothetical protein BFW01_g5916 [Lasiodiplodia theobromae]
MPDDLPPFEVVSHLHGTDLTCEGALFDAITGKEKTRFSDFIRADRQKLRNWLSTNLPIEWGKKFERFEENADAVTVFFADGTSVSGSILVGADGANSRVRNQLLGPEKAQLNLIPVDMLVGEVELGKEEYEEQLQFGRSLWIAEAPVGYIFTGLHSIAKDKASAKYYWMVFRKSKDLTGKVHPYLSWTKQQLYDAAVETTKLLHPKFANVILKSSPENMVQPPYVLEDWIPPVDGFSSDRATILGDAAHKMSPFGGEGGNHAMQDAIDFVKALDGFNGTNPAPLLKDYEKVTIERGREAVFQNRKKTTDWEHETSAPTWSETYQNGDKE